MDNVGIIVDDLWSSKARRPLRDNRLTDSWGSTASDATSP